MANSFSITGNIGRANTTQNGCFRSVAVSQPARNGEKQPDMWIPVAAFGPKAEELAQMPVGAFVTVSGFVTHSREHGITLRMTKIDLVVKKADEQPVAEVEQPVAEAEQPVIKKTVRRARKQAAEVAS